VAAASTGSQGPGLGAQRAMTIRNVVMALLGAMVLVLLRGYDGPFEVMLGSYGGNVAVSFALYFAALNATARYQRPRFLAASATLLAVELFEVTDGFGIMANTFDPIDLVANAAGVGLAVIVDVVTTPILRRHRRQDPNGHGSRLA
jgi:hypothetical protein